jgi:hexokinase
MTGSLDSITSAFSNELTVAASGKKTSLPFIIHTIPATSLVPDNETFQVLAMGGSVFLNALLKKQREHFRTLRRESKNTGIFKTKEDFLSFIEDEIDPSVRFIALNFAYPLDPVFENGRLDGKLVMGSKENTFEGLVGEKVGVEIEKRIFAKSRKKITVSVANDTICLLLSGLTEVNNREEIAAGILGTGMNFAFFLDKDHPVNLEAANFDKFDQTDTGEIIDAASASPGMALLEKEVSGAYLYKHFNEILKRDNIDFPPLKATKELDALLDDPKSVAYPIAKMLLERSAGLIASVIAGITLYKQKDMTFVMEGSLFWSARYFRQNVKRSLLKLVPEYTVTFIKIDDSPIFGAAKLIA